MRHLKPRCTTKPLLEIVAARGALASALNGELNFDEEVSLLEENRRQLESYRAAVSDSVKLRLALVETLYLLGQRYQWRGDVSAAIRCWRSGCRHGKGLETALPEVPYAWFFSIVSALELPRGDPDALTPAQAIPRLEKAVQLLEIDYALNPEHVWIKLRTVGRCLASCYLGAGRPADALRMERRAAEALPPRPDGIPFVELRRLYGTAYLARREQETGQSEAARRHAQEAADGFEAFCRIHAADAALLDVAVRFCTALAPPLRHAGSVDQSRRVVECALHVLRQRSGVENEAARLRNLTQLWTHLAKCGMRDNPDDVEVALREAADTARRLVALHPENRLLLDERLARLARWLAGCGRRSQAAACLRESARLWDQDADGLRGVARRFRDLANKGTDARQTLSSEDMAEREAYLTEAARLEKAANALSPRLTNK